MDFLISFHWEIFIGLEILSFVFLLTFFVIRYWLHNLRISKIFLGLFTFFIVLEGILAIIVYQRTGEIAPFQVVVFIFILYAFTFGLADFKKLDLFMKRKIGKWRNVNLLTEADKERIKRDKDPTYQAKQYRHWWYGHLLVFIIAHGIFWLYYGKHETGFIYYVTDLSWWSDVEIGRGPFRQEMVAQISKLWILIFGLDTVISWSYTLFPSQVKEHKDVS